MTRTPFSRSYQATKAATQDQARQAFTNGAADPAGASEWTPEYIASQAQNIGNIVQAGQMIVGNLTSVDMANKLETSPLGVDPSITMRDTGISKADEYQRPFWEIVKADRNDNPDALQAGLRRLEVLTDTDLQMAKVRQAQISLKAAGRKTYRRVTTSDNPCDLCEIAATQVYFTEDLMPIHPGCVPGDSLVVASTGTVAVTRRIFEGELVEFRTASGNLVRVTPNHPVLTDEGWLPAGLIRQGDTVFRSINRHRTVDGRPEIDQRPISIKDVWNAAVVEGLLIRMPLAAKDFHSDRAKGEVDIVWPTGDLATKWNVELGEIVHEQGFVLAGWEGVALTERSTFASFDQCGFTSSRSFVGSSGNGGAIFGSGILIPKRSSLFGVTRYDAPAVKFDGNSFAAYANRGRALQNRLAGKIECDSVIECRLVGFSGHVYNLHTVEGWYTCNNSIVSNCSCDVEADDSDQTPVITSFTGTVGDEEQNIEVRQHGEIGPMLTWAKQNFLGPQDLPSPPTVAESARLMEESGQRQLAMQTQQLARAVEHQGTEDFRRVNTTVERQEKIGEASKLLRPEDLSSPRLIAQSLSERTGIPVNFEGARDIPALKSLSRAIEDMTTKYPQVPLRAVSTAEKMVNLNAYAETGLFDLKEQGASEIHYNPRFFTKSNDIIGSYAHDVETGYHPTTDGKDGVYGLTVHEFAHSLDRFSQREASDRAVGVLRRTYLELYPSTPERVENDIALMANAAKHGITLADPAVARYQYWLDNSLSKYSFTEMLPPPNANGFVDLNKTIRAVNGHEAVAEAFAHVEVDPANATEAERALHDLLVESANVPHDKPLSIWDRPTFGARGPIKSPYDATGPMAEHTVGQDVRDIVRNEHGVTINLEGHRPAEGYAYAPHKDTELKVALDEFTPAHVDRYVDEHWDELSKAGNHLGIWEEDGNVYLDVSRVGAADEGTIAAAQAAHQLGVYDLSAPPELGTVNIGHITEDGKYVSDGTPTSLHDQHQRQVEAASQRRSASGPVEIPSGTTETRTPAQVVDAKEAVRVGIPKSTSESYRASVAEHRVWMQEKPSRDRIAKALVNQTRGRAAFKPDKHGTWAESAIVRAQMVPRRIAHNMIALAREGITPQIEAWAKVWYPDARIAVNDIRHKYADPFDEMHAMGIAAAFSPQREWAQNLIDVEAFTRSAAAGESPAERMASTIAATAKGQIGPDGQKLMQVTEDNITRAEAVLHARNFNEIDLALRGVKPTITPHYDNSQKIRNFVRNLLGNHRNLTMDTWAGRTARLSPDERRGLLNEAWAKSHPKAAPKYGAGERVGYKDVQLAERLADKANEVAAAAGVERPYMPNPADMINAGYDILEQAMRYAVEDYGTLTPDEFQAALWIVLRGTGA